MRYEKQGENREISAAGLRRFYAAQCRMKLKETQSQQADEMMRIMEVTYVEMSNLLSSKMIKWVVKQGKQDDGRVLQKLQIGHETSLSLVDSLYAAVLQQCTEHR